MTSTTPNDIQILTRAMTRLTLIDARQSCSATRVPKDPSVPSPDGVCHFLRLPAELRNKVYEYYLTEPEGLIYREDGNGVGKLCIFNDCEEEHQEEGHDVYDMWHAKNRRHVIPPRAEMEEKESEENERKENGESEKEGLILKLKRSRPSDNKEAPAPSSSKRLKFSKEELLELHEANQLRFINRQLFWETKGLGIRYNDLRFRDEKTSTNDPETQCWDFIGSCSGDQRAYLRKLTVDMNMVEKPGQEKWRLRRFCDKYPQATILFRLANWHQVDKDFMTRALTKTWLLRRRPDFQSKMTLGDPTLEAIFHRFLSRPRRTIIYPPNFRLLPRNELFNEDVFRRVCEQHNHPYRNVLANAGPRGLDSWVALAKDMYENGV